MIPVSLKPEPVRFEVDVRQPGVLFLNSTPTPTSRDFSPHAYWLKVAPDMQTSYFNICAYTGCRIHTDATIDHFLPKVLYPHLAYEWSNYRLCMNKINQRKSQDHKIVDPFQIKVGWFQLDFPSCYVVPGEALSPQDLFDVEYTIKKLQLNDNQLLNFRCETVLAYIDGDCTFHHLENFYPFVASEIIRQGLEATLHTLFPGRKIFPSSNTG